jgi:CDP-diacylglycerol--glycerol-3-phosphate 3-phosphatidyltransferase
MNWPIRLTVLRILLFFPWVLMALHAAHDPSIRGLLVVLTLFMGFTDFLDGLLARRLNQQTPVGAFLDAFADKVCLLGAFVLLALPRWPVGGEGLEPLLPAWALAVFLARDLFMAVGTWLVYRRLSALEVRPLFLGKAASTVQTLLVVFILWEGGPSFLKGFLLYASLAGAIASAAVYAGAGWKEYRTSNGRVAEV